MVLKFCTLALAIAAVLSAQAQAFVLLSGPTEARLPASEAAPEIQFMVHSTPPPISEKDELAAGLGPLVTEQEFWIILIQLAMQQWNDVNGSYLQLSAQISDAATLDSSDNVFSIVVGSTNLTSAAYAQPEIIDGVISDCDIAVSERSSAAESLAYTLMHELGHCLGLGHNHGDYKAAMGYSRENRNLSLGLDDEAGLIYLYPEAAVGAPQELIHCGTIAAVNQGHWPQGLLYALPLVLPTLRRRMKKLKLGE